MSRWPDLAQWRGPTPNQSGAMKQQRGLVVHIASGYFEGTIAWEKNPEADVSSHFVAGRAGQLAQLVDTDRTAWTQRDGNGYWLSVECEGFAKGDKLLATHPGWDRLTVEQMTDVAALLLRGHEQYGYPLQLAGDPKGYGLGYHSMGAENSYNWGHMFCPGEPIKAQLPEILRMAKAMKAAKTASGTPAGPGRVEDTMWQGIVREGKATTVVCTPWDETAISFGCDFGRTKLRVARHQVPGVGRAGGWTTSEFVISSEDKMRHDLPALEGVDRTSIVRIPLTEADGPAPAGSDPTGLETPAGYLAWLA
jgi:hypothetical protein